MEERRTPYWWGVLDEAEERVKRGEPAFTDEEKLKACNWPTCACGKQDERIPSFGQNAGPRDCYLARLGVVFSNAVGNEDITYARETLLAIEQRAAEVLAELEGQPCSQST